MFIIKDKKNLKFLFVYLKTQRIRLTFLFLLIATNISLQIYNPQYIKSFIDSAIEGRDQSILLLSASIFLLLTLFRQLIIILIQFVTSNVTWKITNKLRIDLVKLCLSYDFSFHNQHTPGVMVDRIDGDVSRLNNFMSTFVLKVISNNLLILGIVVVLFSIHPIIGLAVGIALMIGLYILTLMSNHGSKTIHNYLSEASEFIGFIDERITGREDIRAFNAERYTLNRFYEKLKKLYKVRKRTGLNIANVTNAGEMVLAFILVVTILTMGLLYLYGEKLSLGTMFLIYFYITILLVPLKNLVAEVQDLQHVNASLLRINELMSYANKVKDEGRLELKDNLVSIEYENVSFGYNENYKILENINIKIPANKTLGIIGKTGSGKTTLARLLYRLYEIQEGRIKINDTDIRDIKLDNLRSDIAIISQNIELFEGTLRENITLFRDNIDDTEIWDIFDKLSISDWINDLTNGLDRKIERDGKNISAGEAQLISLSRAFIKNPKIVILDEATSRIDSFTEKLIEKALKNLIENRTSIIIAHRLSTIRNCDYILVMKNGTVQEFGLTEELARNVSSEYYKLLNGEVAI